MKCANRRVISRKGVDDISKCLLSPSAFNIGVINKDAELQTPFRVLQSDKCI